MDVLQSVDWSEEGSQHRKFQKIDESLRFIKGISVDTSSRTIVNSHIDCVSRHYEVFDNSWYRYMTFSGDRKNLSMKKASDIAFTDLTGVKVVADWQDNAGVIIILNIAQKLKAVIDFQFGVKQNAIDQLISTGVEHASSTSNIDTGDKIEII